MQLNHSWILVGWLSLPCLLPLLSCLFSILRQTIVFLFRESLDHEHSSAINLPYFTSALSKSKGDIFKHGEGRSLQTEDNPPSEWSDIKHEMRSGVVNAVSAGRKKNNNQKQNTKTQLGVNNHRHIQF